MSEISDFWRKFFSEKTPDNFNFKNVGNFLNSRFKRKCQKFYILDYKKVHLLKNSIFFTILKKYGNFRGQVHRS